MKKPFLILGAMLIAAIPVLAQEHDHATPQTQTPQAQAPQGGMMSGMRGMQNMGPMLGQHMMPVTITGIDSETGLVDATAGSMSLKLHFPLPSLAGMKAGDKISVHLAFRKG
ncbi:MAG TPA: hypothetical protein VJ798_00915 [Rhizomicrobium sp.]|nr:hypothetical protein [Rhizomicrobium sp.]